MHDHEFTKAVAAVHAAWTDPGPRPAIHRDAQRQLREQWPALARALDQLAHVYEV